MALFKVEEVINGNTIRVTGWKWAGSSGQLVKIQGYSVPNNSYENYVKNKLQNLLEGKLVDLRRVLNVDRGLVPNSDTIYCSVYLNDIDIATYFRELSTFTGV